MLKRVAVLLLLIILAISAWGVWYLRPYGREDSETFVDIERGTGSRAIAEQLAEQGLVRSPWAFLIVRAFHPRAALQAGEYRFDAIETPWQIFEKIRKGLIFYEEITVPEGSNMFDIANLLRKGGTVDADAFLKAAANPALIHDLDKAAPNLEGFLFPSTYRVTHKTTAQQLCRAMTAEFRRRWFTLGAPSSGSSVHKTVT